MAEAMSTEGAAPPVEADGMSAGVVRVMSWIDRYGVLLLILIMGVLSWLAQPDVFLSERNVFNIFRQTNFYALLALGQFIVIVTAGIDLSVGSTLVLSMMTTAVLAQAGVVWPVVLAAPFVVGLMVGVVNGLGLTKLHMPHPFIMTLGMMFIARGVSNLISGGVPISGLPAEVRWLGSGNIVMPVLGWEVPVSLVVVVITYIVAWVFLQHVRTGRHIFAIGGNPQAARVSGVNVDRTLVIAYALCGMLAGFAALLLAGRTNSGFPNAGLGDELVAISAVIIGGASFFGGRGTVLGVFAGVLVIGMLRNLLNLSNVQVFWQQVLIGVVIIAVVAFDVLRRRVAASS
jgi:ribose/xylose/arabinose/galactoside ABC-type transport system permease subunit